MSRIRTAVDDCGRAARFILRSSLTAKISLANPGVTLQAVKRRYATSRLEAGAPREAGSDE